MHNPLLIHQVEAKPLGLLPFSLPPCPVRTGAPAASGRTFGLRRTRRDKGAIDRQHHDRPPRLARRHLRHAVGNLGGRGTRLQHTHFVAQLSCHLMERMIAQRQASQFPEQLLGRLKRDLCGQSGPGLLQVPWRAALGQLEHVIQGREALLTLIAVEVGTGQGHRAHHGMHRARLSRARRQKTLTVGTRHRALVEHSRMLLFHQGLGDPARQLLAHGKHRLGQRLRLGVSSGMLVSRLSNQPSR